MPIIFVPSIPADLVARSHSREDERDESSPSEAGDAVEVGGIATYRLAVPGVRAPPIVSIAMVQESQRLE